MHSQRWPDHNATGTVVHSPDLNRQRMIEETTGMQHLAFKIQ